MRARIKQCCITVGAVLAFALASVGCVEVDLSTDDETMPLAGDDWRDPVPRLNALPDDPNWNFSLPPAVGGSLTDEPGSDPVEESAARVLLRDQLAENLVVDERFLCWSVNGDVAGKHEPAIYGLNMLGGKSLGVVEESPTSHPMDLAADEESVYWVDFGDGRVLKAAFDGGRVTLLAKDQAGPYSIAVDDTYVYWTNLDDGSVNRVAKQGGDILRIAEGQAYPGSIAVAEGEVFWGNLGDGDLNAVSIDGRGLRTLVTSQTFSSEIVADGKYLYWSNAMQRAVMQVGIDEQEAQVIAVAQYQPAGIATDEHFVYWVTQADGAVRRVKKDGGEPQLLAADQQLPTHIAVDKLRVYWTNTADATVMYLVK